MISRCSLNLLLLLALVGCGQTGPLSLPAEKTQAAKL